MKSNKLAIIIAFFAFLFFSCDGSGGIFDPDDLPTDPRFGNFWALNCRNGKYYRIAADKLYTGSKCVVWAEKGKHIDTFTARKIGEEYDNYIYPSMIDAFSVEYTEGYKLMDDTVIYNIMDLASWMTKGDGKLCILLLDIQDSYVPPNGSYVAGYFLSNNFFDRSNSNVQSMIYIDVDPAVPGSHKSNTTLAHELQHLMNFVHSYWYRTEGNTYSPMDLWIDEGLSAAAEWVYGNAHPGTAEEHPEDRWKWFNEDAAAFGGMKGLVSKGNNFYIWGNRERENPYAVLDDYATVYLFFQWLRLQAKAIKGYDTHIYYDILTSDQDDYRAVTEAADSYMAGNGFDNWGTLLKTWMAANYINANTGLYGYRNDPTLKQIRAKTVYTGSNSIPLFPGEGVYSAIVLSVDPTPSTFIKYAGLNRTASPIVESGPFTSDVLLTYNMDTTRIIYWDGSEGGNIVDGEITGYPSINYNTDQSSRQITRPFGPYPVSAADMLRRNGYNERSSGQGMVKLRDRIVYEK